MNINITKRDGAVEPFNADKINESIARAAEGLSDPVSKTVQIASELAITLFDRITSEQLDKATIQVAVQNIKEDPEFDKIATRLLLKTVYKSVLGSFRPDTDILKLHRAHFPAYVHKAVALNLLDPRLTEVFDLEQLAEALDPSRDDLFRYIGAVTLTNRYAITNPAGVALETPQFFWMRVAMGLSLNEQEPTAAAIKFYDKISRLDYLPAGSTLVNAGTSHPQLSNCFVIDMEDDIDHITTTMTNVMKITKGTGGIGLAATKLRAEGSPIRSNNTKSTGPIPFLHTIDSILRAISRGGKKFGALAVYIENWHMDIDQFLDLRQNSGDPYRRLRTANTALWISDEFMKRVGTDDDWYLFDPLETPDLTELYGEAFSKRYADYVQKAQSGQIKLFRRVRAREQWIKILNTLQATSHPWLTWKDSVNTRALNNNTGTIHLSNLCTEITLPQDRDNISVCNLASVNLSTHLVGNKINWERMGETTRLAVRQLDNLIDITMAGVQESTKSNLENRAIGLGVMGFTDITERLGFAYDSEESYDLADKIFEFISYHAIDESANLAQERGAYQHFEGSGWSQGRVPIDTLNLLEADRQVPVAVNRARTLDWDSLRMKVKEGVRNATLMAVAPTASIGLVAGTTPGLDPQFSQIFSRATSSGKFLEVNHNLVNALKARNLWESVRDDLLVAQGDLSRVEGIPNDLQAVYRTSFQVSPYSFIEVAARAQKWVDQAISRNIYLETRDVNEMSRIYFRAWELGVKTTYYLHVKPRHTAEQSTTKVNKAVSLPASSSSSGPRRGFGAKKASQPVVPVQDGSRGVNLPEQRPLSGTNPGQVTAETCPVDPAEREACDSCQ